RSIAIQIGVLQDRAKAVWIGRIAVMHANNLEAIKNHLFVVQYPDTRAANCVEILLSLGKLFVVSRHEISAELCGRLFPWCNEFGETHLATVVQVTRDEYNIWPQTPEHGDDTLHKSETIDGA